MNLSKAPGCVVCHHFLRGTPFGAGDEFELCNILSTTCGHLAHEYCLHHWWQSAGNKSCPYCGIVPAHPGSFRVYFNGVLLTVDELADKLRQLKINDEQGISSLVKAYGWVTRLQQKVLESKDQEVAKLKKDTAVAKNRLNAARVQINQLNLSIRDLQQNANHMQRDINELKDLYDQAVLIPHYGGTPLDTVITGLEQCINCGLSNHLVDTCPDKVYLRIRGVSTAYSFIDPLSQFKLVTSIPETVARDVIQELRIRFGLGGTNISGDQLQFLYSLKYFQKACLNYSSPFHVWDRNPLGCKIPMIMQEPDQSLEIFASTITQNPNTTF